MLKLLAVLLVLQAHAVAAQDKYAPLPEKVVNAKTVFYINDTSSSRFGDDLYQELKKWNRWQVVTDRKQADLILVLSQRDQVEGTIATATATTNENTAYATGTSAPIKSSSWHIFYRPDEWTDGLDIKSYAWREAMAELGKRCKVPSVGYSEADEVMPRSMKTQTTKARTSGVALGRCHEKLSLAVQTMCTSPQSLRYRLGNAVLCHFSVLIENFFPEEFREQFREIHNSLTKAPDTRKEGLYMASIHNMKPKEVGWVVDKMLVLREDVARAYYKRSFNR